MNKPQPKPKPQDIPWWQLPGYAILNTPTIRKLYGLDTKKPTTLTEIGDKPKEKE